MAGLLRRVLTAVVCVVTIVAWCGVLPARALFSSTLSRTGNSIAADTDFTVSGALTVWGDTGGVHLGPSQVGTGTAWSAATVGDRMACGIAAGKLFCFGGGNSSGQQGVNDVSAHVTPVQVGSADWLTVAAGSNHTCGIQADSTLWCWGANANGQLAQPTTTTSSRVPVQVTTPGLTGWVSVSAGTEFTCATRTDGSLYCWGRNGQGQLGIGATTPASSSTPLQVVGNGWTSIALGAQHACGRQSSTVSCWGTGGSNRLGQATNTAYASPMTVAGSYTGLAVGSDHACAINPTGQLYCWGSGGNGRLGRGTTSSTTSGPVLIGGATDTWRSVSAHQSHTCGTRTDNSLYCWGGNTFGQIGDGTVTDQLSPVKIGGSVWSTVAPGEIAAMSCAIRTDGTLWCWGVTGLPLFKPVRVGSGTTWRQAASGEQFVCAIRDAGALYCFGQQNSGRLGAGDNAAHFGPTQVAAPAGTAFSQVTAGQYHACAVGADTTLWCWGSAVHGQTGQGTSIQQNSPVPVTSPASTGWAGVSAGALHSCGIRTDTTMYCWGQNTTGELGQGATGSAQSTPVAVTTPAATGWVQVSAGFQHTCALRTDSKVYCWGSNGSGRLGLGTTAPAYAPTAISGSGEYLSIGLGTDHSCGIRTNGTLWCWGSGTNGRLGNGATTPRLTPTQVTGSSAWRRVSGGTPSTCGVRADNSVWCWGGNASGQLGLGDAFSDQLAPVRIGLTGRPVSGGPASNLVALIAY